MKRSQTFYLGLLLCALFAAVLAGTAFLFAAQRQKKQTVETAESVLDMAAAETAFFDYRRALVHFEKAESLATVGSDAWALAVYGQACCIYHVTPVTPVNVRRASELFTLVHERRPDHRAGRQGALMLGRIQELKDFLADTPNLPAARKWYQLVLDQSPGTDEADQAALRLAGTYIQTYDPADCHTGLQLLANYLIEHPHNTLAPGMLVYMGDTCFYPLADFNKALGYYTRADAMGLPQSGREPQLYWRMASLAERLNDPVAAIGFYRKVLEITPTSGKSYEAGLAIKRLEQIKTEVKP